jgi:hypothetical protein
VQRSALRTVLLAILCLSALTLAASTLDTVQTDGSGFGGGGGGDPGRSTAVGGGDPAQPRETTQSPSGDDERVTLCEPAVKEPPVILAVVVAAILTFFGLYRWRDEFVAIAGTLIVFGPITLLLLVLAQCEVEQPEPDTPNASVPNGSGGGGTAGGAAGGSGVPDPSLPILALAALAVVVALVVVAYYLTGDDTGETEPEGSEADDEEEDPAVDADDVAEVGRLAGEAADRIESADDFENQVFRAWLEMTRPLNLDHPRSSTPAEFAAAARGAGMSGEHVDRLTELFDQVRYGGREATAEREREAVSLLRSIESEYADVETPADLPGDDERGGDGGERDGEVSDE